MTHAAQFDIGCGVVVGDVVEAAAVVVGDDVTGTAVEVDTTSDVAVVVVPAAPKVVLVIGPGEGVGDDATDDVVVESAAGLARGV